MIDLSLSNPNAMWGLLMGKDLEPKQRLLVTLAAAQIPASNSMGALYFKSPIDDLVKAQTDLTTVKSTLAQAQSDLAQLQSELASLRRTLRMEIPSSVGPLKLKVAGGANPEWVLQENPGNVLSFSSPTDQEEVQIRVDSSKGGLAKIDMTADGFTRRIELNVIQVSTPSPP
jgi:hypothetical protein